MGSFAWCGCSIRPKTYRCLHRSSCGSSTTGCYRANSLDVWRRWRSVTAVCAASRGRLPGSKSTSRNRQIEALAKQVNLSPSALHHYFKAVAAMSPVQYQKRLRLQEARRLLLADTTSAEAVAYEVGYASPSQF